MAVPKLPFLKATLKSEDVSVLVPAKIIDEAVEDKSVSVPTETDEVVSQDLWATLDVNQKTEFNKYISIFSEADFGTNPYIKDSDIRQYSNDELIKFAIAYNIEHFDDRYGIDDNNDEYISISDSYIRGTIKELFDIDIKHKSVSGYDHKDGKYLWDAYRWAKINANKFSQVETLTKNGDETYTAEIGIYTDNSNNSEDSTNQTNSPKYEPKESAWNNDQSYSYIGSAKATFKVGNDGGSIITHYEITSLY
jgi:hypothetical protein